MAGYCTSVRLYFHEPQASENTAQECGHTSIVMCKYIYIYLHITMDV